MANNFSDSETQFWKQQSVTIYIDVVFGAVLALGIELCGNLFEDGRGQKPTRIVTYAFSLVLFMWWYYCSRKDALILEDHSDQEPSFQEKFLSSLISAVVFYNLIAYSADPGRSAVKWLAFIPFIGSNGGAEAFRLSLFFFALFLLYFFFDLVATHPFFNSKIKKRLKECPSRECAEIIQQYYTKGCRHIVRRIGVLIFWLVMSIIYQHNWLPPDPFLVLLILVVYATVAEILTHYRWRADFQKKYKECHQAHLLGVKRSNLNPA